MTTIEELLVRLGDLQQRQQTGQDVGTELAEVRAELQEVKRGSRRGSRFAGPGADLDVVRVLSEGGHVAANGDLVDGKGKKIGAVQPAHDPAWTTDSQGRMQMEPPGADRFGTGSELLRNVLAARKGDPVANARLHSADTKGWVEGTGSAGGFLVSPEVLPGYLPARRASSPLRERCRTALVASDEVWLTTEGNAVTVAHVPEATTIPESTGTVGQKISTVFKVAGSSRVSYELLSDTNGNAGDLVGRQFGQQIGIAIDQKIIGGSGTGEPTGIRNTAGVASTAVDGQSGRELVNSILKAVGRLRERFFAADTVAIHPRDLTKVDLATTTTNEYLFPSGLQAVFPGQVVVDANLPTNLGAGTNESVILVGEFASGAYFFQREAVRVDISEDAYWSTDEIGFRGRERYGFTIALPTAFEILTGITP